jgi:nucleoid-associated protein YgaU
MIYADSRYADGYLQKSLDARTGTYTVGVLRSFPTESSSFYYYVWTSRDRLDKVALERLGNPNLWWRIMDYNPEVTNPFEIQPGATLRIPSV